MQIPSKGKTGGHEKVGQRRTHHSRSHRAEGQAQDDPLSISFIGTRCAHLVWHLVPQVAAVVGTDAAGEAAVVVRIEDIRDAGVAVAVPVAGLVVQSGGTVPYEGEQGELVGAGPILLTA